MTSKELMAKYRACGEQDLPVFLHFLADHWHALRLADGQALNDNIDSAAALRELAECAKLPEPKPRPGYNVDFCPDCGHVHVDDIECGFPSGAGGRTPCRCERAVRA